MTRPSAQGFDPFSCRERTAIRLATSRKKLSELPVLATLEIRSKKGGADDAIRFFPNPSLHHVVGDTIAHFAACRSVLERISKVASTRGDQRWQTVWRRSSHQRPLLQIFASESLVVTAHLACSSLITLHS
jgi:hypothetical protein